MGFIEELITASLKCCMSFQHQKKWNLTTSHKWKRFRVNKYRCLGILKYLVTCAYMYYESWGGTSDFRLPTSDFRLLTSDFDFQLPTSDFRLRTSESWVLTSDFRLPTSDFWVLSSDFRLPTSDFRLPTSFFQLPTDFRRTTYLPGDRVHINQIRIV